ncbi:MAG: DegQ family serine endoprotease [Gammaproteobacteria bacterium]|nr:DegQ family serine endoprotease [Gammaproteobacteria bacterium]
MNYEILLSKRVLTLVFVCLALSFQPLQARSLPDFVPLVEKNAAAVVNISTTLKKGGRRSQIQGHNLPDIPEDSPFYDFFNKFFGEIPEGVDPHQQRTSLGSGFIMSDDGFIITNNHVVKDADEIIVRLNDRREFVAELIGADERSDLAVLKIEGKRLPTLNLGDSSRLKVGEWVLAIGSPFGFDHSVTQGIISAMGRSLPNENYVPFIQTDVSINPGNSGGPLFNLQGEVIGVNSQIYSRTGGYMGMSFAIPVNVVKDIYQQLKEEGHVSRGWLGVLIQDVTRELAESFGMKKPHGALVAKVLNDSPAEEAGFMVGDVIISFNKDNIGVSSDLPPMVGSTKVGKSVPVEVIRHGKSVSLQVKIAELPVDDSGRLSSTGENGKKGSNPLNVFVEDLTEQQRQELEIKDYGVIVSQISSGPAYKAGVRNGDVMLLLNNVKIKNAKHFEELVNQLPKDKSVPMLIQRRGGPIFLALRLEEDS